MTNMKKLLLSALLGLFCIGASAQIVTSTSRMKTVTRHYEGVIGWQVAVDGLCVIGPYWYLCSGAEVSAGYRYPSGLYLGGQVGGGYGDMEGKFSGGYVPFRFDARYYFSSNRVQPYAQFATGIFFLFGGGIAPYNIQIGPGVSVGITNALSVQLAVNADLALSAAAGVKFAPTEKVGVTYHFGL